MHEPDYLRAPSLEGHRYGTLRYSVKARTFGLSGEPMLLDYAKRLFPGAVVRGRTSRGGELHFPRGRREVSDLVWLLQRFPVHVECPEVLEEARTEAIAAVAARTSGHDLRPIVPPGEFTGKLMTYQRQAVSFLTINERCLLGDGMGLGKTWSALASAAQGGQYPVLVVCQTHVQEQWQRMIGMLFDLPQMRHIVDASPFEQAQRRGRAVAPILRGRTPGAIPATPFLITHYGLIAYWGKTLRKHGVRTLIFDEVQELRHTGTNKYSEASQLSTEAKYVWGLSGTPVFGYGAEIWAVTNALEMHALGSWDAFSREWCTGYGTKIVEDPRSLNDFMVREGLLLRRRWNDPEVNLDLPKVSRLVQDVAHDEAVYDELIAAARAMADGYGTAHFVEKGRLARQLDQRSRQACGVAKARYVAEFVARLIEVGEVPLVYAWHKRVHGLIEERLKRWRIPVFTGDETAKQKRVGLKAFMDGQADGALLSLRSAAGLDGLQRRATCCVFAELDWSPAVHGQCETRIARMGVNEALDDIPSYYCVSRVGHDEIILDVLGVKTGQFAGIMGDEPESYEEQQAAEERATGRIKQLVKRLQGEARARRPGGVGALLGKAFGSKLKGDDDE